MAKKKRKPDKASPKPAKEPSKQPSKPQSKQPAKPPRKPSRTPGFSPASPGPLEGMARNLAGGRGKRHRSPLSIAQEIADAAWEAAQPQEQMALAQHALSVSPDCADAYVILANQSPSRQQARELLEEGVAAGARAIGTQEFKSSTGHFWLDTRTRPYMRARLGLAQCLWESGQRSEAAGHYMEMLRLNPNDNQGIRYLLLGALVELDRDAEAQRLLASYEQDSSAEWAYTSALLAFRRDGDSVLGRSLLEAAVATNEYVPEYLVGNKGMPPSPPVYVSPGGEDEAISYVAQFLRTWRGSPGAIPWLRKTLKVPLPQPPKPRKPAWPLFRHAFLRLPKVKGEVWQLDICRLPLLSSVAQAHAGNTARPPWALVLWNRTQDSILTFEAGDDQPTTAEAWDMLIEALLRPRAGEPHRPSELHVRRKTFFKAWQVKLRQVEINCRLVTELDRPGRRARKACCSPRPAASGLMEMSLRTVGHALIADELAALLAESGRELAAGRTSAGLPGWLEQEGYELLAVLGRRLASAAKNTPCSRRPHARRPAGGMDLEERLRRHAHAADGRASPARRDRGGRRKLAAGARGAA